MQKKFFGWTHLMEFFKRIDPLKQVFYKYLGEEM